MIALLVALIFTLPAFASTQFTAFDAGEGLALLFRQGDRGILIDTGPVSHTASILKRAKEDGVKILDYLVLTHLHADHASGLFRAIEAFPGVKILENCHFQKTQKSQEPLLRWLVEALERHSARECVAKGHQISWQGLKIQILAPEKIQGEDLNANSLVLLVNSGKENILIMGDAGIEQEKALLTSKTLPEKISILVAGHHGAEDASHEEFIKFVKPDLSIIAVDKNNFWQRPSPAVLARLKKYSSKVLQTGIHGDIRRTLHK